MLLDEGNCILMCILCNFKGFLRIVGREWEDIEEGKGAIWNFGGKPWNLSPFNTATVLLLLLLL